jgi:predicted metal-dependent hydrolase
LSSDPYTTALAMFDRGEYFESHELLEDLWRAAPQGEERTYLQALIQIAVACCHEQRGNGRGARSVYQRARARLLTLPPRMRGINLTELIDALDRYFRGEPGASPPRLTRVERLTQTTEESDAGNLTRDIVL